MKCIIVDDEATARAIISQLCSTVDDIDVLIELSSATQAIKYLNQNDVDLVFLDIHMPDFTGFDFIETIKNPPVIILTTSDPTFTIQALEYECVVDYLVKPLTPQRFQKAVTKASTSFKESETETSSIEKEDTSSGNTLYVNIDRRLIKIDIPSIYLIESKGDYINIKTEEKNFVVHSTLKKIEHKLPNEMFLKVHRSYIINFDKIIDVKDNRVLIKEDIIPVSRSNRPELMRRLNLL